MMGPGTRGLLLGASEWEDQRLRTSPLVPGTSSVPGHKAQVKLPALKGELSSGGRGQTQEGYSDTVTETVLVCF